MSDAWSVLVTGPTTGLDRWCAAARDAGFDARPWPLLEVRPIEGPLLAEDAPLPDWIAVTSANALPALAAAVRARPALAGCRFVAVGEATATEMAALELPEPLLPVPGAQHAAGLADTLAAHAQAGERVLWPRGDKAHELKERLERAGLLVADPLAYETVEVAHDEPAPRTDIVFFASPSAVRAWCVRDHGFRPAAIAIGWTTYEALEEHETRFSTCLPLVSPSLHAFQDCLRSFVPSE